MSQTNYKVTNTFTDKSLIVDQFGFDSLIASHTHNMHPLFAAITAQIIKSDVAESSWEDSIRGIKIEKSNLPASSIKELWNEFNS